MALFKQLDVAKLSPRLWLGLSFLVVILLVNSWVLFFLKLPVDNSYFWASLHNAGHALIFLGLGLTTSLTLHRYVLHQQMAMTALVTLLVCLLFGGAVELVQARVGREASWFDFRLDIVGTLAGLGFYYAVYTKGIKRLVGLLVFALLLMVGVSEPVKWAFAERYRAQAFPVLADFDNHWLNAYAHSAYRAKFSIENAPSGWLGNTSKVGRLDLVPGPWPGVTIEEVHPDWREHSTFSVDIFNPIDEDVRLVVRIHDAKHNNQHNDRFNKTYQIKPGLQTIRIPLQKIKMAPKKRELDMGRISTVMFYSYKIQEERVLYIDNVVLHQ